MKLGCHILINKGRGMKGYEIVAQVASAAAWQELNGPIALCCDVDSYDFIVRNDLEQLYIDVFMISKKIPDDILESRVEDATIAASYKMLGESVYFIPPTMIVNMEVPDDVMFITTKDDSNNRFFYHSSSKSFTEAFVDECINMMNCEMVSEIPLQKILEFTINKMNIPVVDLYKVYNANVTSPLPEFFDDEECAEKWVNLQLEKMSERDRKLCLDAIKKESILNTL